MKKAFIVDVFASLKVRNPKKSRNRGGNSGDICGRVDDERLAVPEQNGTEASRSRKRLREAAGSLLAQVQSTATD